MKKTFLNACIFKAVMIEEAKDDNEVRKAESLGPVTPDF